jgi:hypothetical protein
LQLLEQMEEEKYNTVQKLLHNSRAARKSGPGQGTRPRRRGRPARGGIRFPLWALVLLVSVGLFSSSSFPHV